MTMNLSARHVEYKDVEATRELYRHEAHCQIIHDSALVRRLAEPYLIEMNGRVAGYGGVWTKIEPGRVMEFYTVPHARPAAQRMYRELIAASGATSAEAQTNMPLMLTMLYDFAADVTTQSILFEDAFTTSLPCPAGAVFRRSTPADQPTMFEHKHEPVGERVVEFEGKVVATGGAYYHYNPPYGDIFMEVAEPAQRKGFGSYLVQEVKRVCYETGKKPAARCNPANVASRATLEKAGFLPCAQMLAGRLREPS